MNPLNIEGSWLIEPIIRHDPRGNFLELYRSDLFTKTVGYPLDLRQASISTSAQNIIRGIHYAVPGQGKYVTCVRGAIMDVVVDIRPWSPTYGQVAMIKLDDINRHAIYLSGDLGHGFCALTDNATVIYLQSEIYDSGTERTLNPLDPAVGVAWPTATPVLSERDLRAPNLDEARSRDLLPSREELK